MLTIVYFAGVDLAWGENKPTGVAVIDRNGCLQHLAAARTDAEILDQLRPYVQGSCLVAVDAPLVVTNPTGTRACESALNTDFRRFDAGTYPANTSLPWFADGGRGARLCRALQLDLDPTGNAPRKAIEVYPHAASVALFGLAKTIKYKQKPGRDIAQLQAEFVRLVSLVEGLQTATPTLSVTNSARWRTLTGSIAAATRKAELRRVEDPVDAVLCAYVALYAATRPDDVAIYGDTTTGCIVTPRL
jgi:predicted RNase H-like nuclease